ncbi:Vitamin B12 import ATP-binding protein BtuD [Pseudoalteromonas sp. CIP111854]|uniref:Vitamin B12 import ATP-binding protein BtuD n=1 Tax=Pseudoalteromonas holothuriae TaxID=2963714 RepID=A0A9W4W025_9GAMM|nr:ATP-binding cassette domain-containing protein [Pseudoalteromonas sp. CIP111854]CAH9066778.1 Vitamin B12 import ATP-binding protein BtuD [Pseudoalteromonas sp. CIP111854]
MIDVIKLHKQFANKRVFHNYTNQFMEPKCCILGENGLGKTTLFTLIAGLDPYYTGDILLAGKRVTALQDYVALGCDKIPFPDFLTARQILSMTSKSWVCDMPLTLAKAFGFEPFLDTLVKDLSSGNNKKLQLLNAIMRNTPYLILDEPSAALDQHGVEVLCHWLQSFSGQVLISSHEPQPFLDVGFVTQHLFSTEPVA